MTIPGGRKFCVAVLALVLAFILGMTDNLDQYFALVASVAVGAFSYANAAIEKAHAQNGGAG